MPKRYEGPLKPSGSTYKPDRGVSPQHHRKSGRRPKFDPARVKIIIEALKAAVPQVVAAKAAGLAYSTVREWVRAGEQNKSPELAQFAEDYSKALATAEGALVYRIRQAAEDGQWTAAAWLLERRWNKRWGRRDQMQLAAANDRPIEFRLTLDKPAFAGSLPKGAGHAGLNPADEISVDEEGLDREEEL